MKVSAAAIELAFDQAMAVSCAWALEHQREKYHLALRLLREERREREHQFFLLAEYVHGSRSPYLREASGCVLEDYEAP